MDARLIPTVLPVAKKIYQLSRLKEELKRYENSREEGIKIERHIARLKENIEKLEKEIGYDKKA